MRRARRTCGISRSARCMTFAVGIGAFVVHNACGDSAKIDFSDNGQIQHEFKHANDFGVSGNYNKANRDAFVDAMKRHMDDADTMETHGYFGSGGRRVGATHYYNPTTGLNVFAHADGRFWGAWKLEAGQAADLLATRKDLIDGRLLVSNFANTDFEMVAAH